MRAGGKADGHVKCLSPPWRQGSLWLAPSPGAAGWGLCPWGFGLRRPESARTGVGNQSALQTEQAGLQTGEGRREEGFCRPARARPGQRLEPKVKSQSASCWFMLGVNISQIKSLSP